MAKYKIEWPTDPKEGEEFSYVEPFGGGSYVYWVFFMGSWQYLKPISTKGVNHGPC